MTMLPLTGSASKLREGELHARRVLGEVGVGECADMKLGALTLGERVRVALAGALIREPRVLLVDEPAVLSSLRESSELFLLLRSIGEGRVRGQLDIVGALELRNVGSVESFRSPQLGLGLGYGSRPVI